MAFGLIFMNVSHILDMAIYELISSKTIAIVSHCTHWETITLVAIDSREERKLRY
jgi:hypothetical protein